MRRVISLVLACTPFFAWAAEPTVQELKQAMVKLMEETKVSAQMGIKVPVAQFKSDGDPNTLELVFLEQSEPGANTVSDDGEVIFLFEPSDKVQSALIAKAFELKARRRLAQAQPAAR